MIEGASPIEVIADELERLGQPIDVASFLLGYHIGRGAESCGLLGNEERLRESVRRWADCHPERRVRCPASSAS